MTASIARLREREDGFTLIELMIVMVVLGILAGIIIFALDPFQKAASDAKTTANTDLCKTAQAAATAWNESHGAPDKTYKDFITDTSITCA